MCGIVGFLQPKPAALSDPRQIIARMTSTLRHRGPDHQGVWLDDAGILALGHRRLSILDLSAAGHQPMLSASRRFVIAFNGEIYNHTDLRATLDAEHSGAWRGSSDTETLLAAIERWGVKAALERSVGMFAFALWDMKTRTLTLARDRMGEKPLYYGRSRGAFLFASELKAFKACPRFGAGVDRQALFLLLRHNCIPAPYSIYRDVAKLPPASYVWFSAAEVASGRLPRPVCYWSLSKQVEEGIVTPFTGSEEEAVDVLDQLLRRAIRLRMASDVPLGAFLSGGIDSSIIVACIALSLLGFRRAPS